MFSLSKLVKNLHNHPNIETALGWPSYTSLHYLGWTLTAEMTTRQLVLVSSLWRSRYYRGRSLLTTCKGRSLAAYSSTWSLIVSPFSISREVSPRIAIWICRRSGTYTAPQSQKAVTAYLKSQQSLPFGFAERAWTAPANDLHKASNQNHTLAQCWLDVGTASTVLVFFIGKLINSLIISWTMQAFLSDKHDVI